MTGLVEMPRVEIIRRCELEKIVDTGLKTFIEVGQALAEIQSRRLYRDEHATFEAYCAAKWDMSRKRAYDFVAAAKVTAELSPIGDTPLPSSESVARELAPLRDEPGQLREAWAEALDVGAGKPTAKIVKDVVAQYRTTEPKTVDRSTQLRKRLAAVRIDEDLATLDAAAHRILDKVRAHGDAAIGTMTNVQVAELLASCEAALTALGVVVAGRDEAGVDNPAVKKMSPVEQLDAEIAAAAEKREEAKRRAEAETLQGVRPAAPKNAILGWDGA